MHERMTMHKVTFSLKTSLQHISTGRQVTFLEYRPTVTRYTSISLLNKTVFADHRVNIVV